MKKLGLVLLVATSTLIILSGCAQEKGNLTQDPQTAPTSFAKVITPQTLPYTLTITGEDFAIKKELVISDLGVPNGTTNSEFIFMSKVGREYSFHLNYKALTENRSYPTNLDITIKDSEGQKIGYLFYAINGVHYLEKSGEFGFIVDIEGKPTDIKFVFDKKTKGTLAIEDLKHERFVQDTLVKDRGFQMIRPVVLPLVDNNTRSQTYALDTKPFAVNYTIKDNHNGTVEFQHNLYQTINNEEKTIYRVYYLADSLETLREGMYAGKYYHPTQGEFKLVYYPVAGQTTPMR